MIRPQTLDILHTHTHTQIFVLIGTKEEKTLGLLVVQKNNNIYVNKIYVLIKNNVNNDKYIINKVYVVNSCKNNIYVGMSSARPCKKE